MQQAQGVFDLCAPFPLAPEKSFGPFQWAWVDGRGETKGNIGIHLKIIQHIKSHDNVIGTSNFE